MRYDTILEALEAAAPPELAEEWDNCGTQIPPAEEQIDTILVCLDVTDEVIAEAKEEKAGLIVSHHPLIFTPLASLDPGAKGSEKAGGGYRPEAEYLMTLARAGIGVYSAHTSFDSAPRGNNHYLAELLGLNEIGRPADFPDDIPGLAGILPEPAAPGELCRVLEDLLAIGAGSVRWVGDPDRAIRKAAICTGAGSELMEPAAAAGCEALITGDVKYHEARAAEALGIILIDAGHWGTEKIFAENMARILREETAARGEAPRIIESVVQKDPFHKTIDM